MILLVRHPPVAAAGRCYGRLDLVADPVAVAALAAGVRARMAGVPVWTSPSRRCRAVAAALGPHEVDMRLHELDFGAWEGVAWDDVPRAALDRWAADPVGFAPPGGETGAALVARVQAFAAERLTAPCVVVTHGGPLKVLTAWLAGVAVQLLAPPPPPGSITALSCGQNAPLASAAATRVRSSSPVIAGSTVPSTKVGDGAPK